MAALILISGYRFYVGIDYEAYRDMYMGYGASYYYMYIIEPAWLILYNLLHAVHGNYNLWFMVIAALTIIPIGYGLRKMSPCTILSWMFFVCSMLYVETFNACRQYVAMAFVFAGIPFLLERKWRFYGGMILLAAMFHYSAIIGILYPLLNREFSLKIRVMLLMCTLVLGEFILKGYVLDLISGIVQEFTSVFGIQRSYGYDLSSHSSGLSNTGLLKYVYNMLALLLCLYAHRIDRRYLFFVNAFIAGICWYNLFYIFQEYLRIYQYFLMSGLILFPAVIYSFRKELRPIACIALIGVFLIFNTKSNWNTVYNTNLTYSLFDRNL